MYNLNNLIIGNPNPNVAFVVELHEALSPLGIAALNREELIKNPHIQTHLSHYIRKELNKIFIRPPEKYMRDLPASIKTEEIQLILIKLINLFGKEILKATLKVYCTPWYYPNNKNEKFTALAIAEYIEIPFHFAYDYERERYSTVLTFMNNWRFVLLQLDLMPQDSLERCLFNIFRTSKKKPIAFALRTFDSISEEERIALAKQLVEAGANPEATIAGNTLVQLNPPAAFTHWFHNEWKSKKQAEIISDHEKQPSSLAPKNLHHFEGLNEFEQLVAQILVNFENINTQVSLITKLIYSCTKPNFFQENPLHFEHFMQNEDLRKKLIAVFIKIEGANPQNFSLLSYFNFFPKMKINLEEETIKELQKEIITSCFGSNPSADFKKRYEQLVCRLFTETTRVKLFISPNQETSSPVLEKLMQLGNSWFLSEVLKSFSKDNQNQLIGETLKAFATSFLRQEEITKPTEDQLLILHSYLTMAEKTEVLMTDPVPMALLLELAFRWNNKKLFQSILEHPKTNDLAAEICLQRMLDYSKKSGVFEDFKSLLARSQVQIYIKMLLKQFPKLESVVKKYAMKNDDSHLLTWVKTVVSEIISETGKKLTSVQPAPSYPQPSAYSVIASSTASQSTPAQPQPVSSYQQPSLNHGAVSYESTVQPVKEETEAEKGARKFWGNAYKRGEEEADRGASSENSFALLSGKAGSPVHEGRSSAEKERKREQAVAEQCAAAPAAPVDGLRTRKLGYSKVAVPS